MPQLVVYATDTMADWEYAYLTTELARAAARPGSDLRLVFAGDGTAQVTSLGRLPITPDIDLDDVDAADTIAFVAPGGETYGAGHERMLATARRLLDADVPVAAICGATLAFARDGLLDERAHTSNARVFLDQSGYAGGANYRDEDVVTDGGITTASGTRPVPFTAEVLERAGVFAPEHADAWLRVNRDNDEQAFYRLVEIEGALEDA
ncbi:thiamine biosynthesis protein ThiJ [Pseudoclavibacter chungangensis]|uniref:Thiamine biosynthesis protein ThiJ n=1 Tax=Pseudoclavibacter chungangensis TaxID=587635 RepID=A0A7J5BRE4_9MICO|nr:DJ-1/PfpI family protein [Pseudoclavibacter chungangensis]KAB1654530.1 thiamine biosynthesis protein ThiJ [Pseudoclavibacter chungangensis]NYJ68244.1 putative intracellular protease/amidase [Pseudoclavibacter chungangensis]